MPWRRNGSISAAPSAGFRGPAPSAGRNDRGAHSPEPTCTPRMGKFLPVVGHGLPSPTAGKNARGAYTPEPTCMPRTTTRGPVSRRVITPLLPRVTKLEPQAGRYAHGPVAARRRDG
jgi:hypothetical protein